MAEAKMILARIGKAMALVSKRVLPQSLLGRAINYSQDLWTELNRYVEDGLVEIDNNLVYAARGIMLSGVSGMARPQMMILDDGVMRAMPDTPPLD